MHDLITSLLNTVNAWGYPGIFILMAMESTVLPIPSELVLIPAGYLAHQGEMNFGMIVLMATLGSWFGASLNYAFAYWVGRPFIEKYGKYFFIKPAALAKTDKFFNKHGAIATFTGRLIPVIRHLISIPAGLTHMNYAQFSLYTCLGAGLWSFILTAMGYFIGDNKTLIEQNLVYVTIGVISFVVLLLALYYGWQKKQATAE